MEPSLPPGITSALQAYLDLLERWNRVHALTALSPEARWEELILDSAALLPFLPAQGTVADLGTGMGIPAMVLALARPDLKIVAVDAVAKKIAFLRQAALELGIPNLDARSARFEQLPPLGADLGVAKALAGIPQLLAWWARHGAPGAPFLALKGPEWEGEGPLPPGWTATAHAYRLPTRGERFVVELRRQ